ncbi:MAG: OmpA family protein [Nitrosomonadales bacterium]|nr:OmpA family protein [Nitrosomonadales bacterium]
MKRSTIAIVVSAALLGMTAAQASEFDGGWIGGKIGSNRSSATGVDTQNATAAGLEAGHNWNMGGFLLGVDGFVDSNSKATHNPGAVSYGSSAYGLDAKLGLPSGNWLPYAKLGYARTNGNGAAGAIGGSDVHLGLGVEYKFAPHWSVAGEYTTASAKSAGTKLNNNNFTLGINYYFADPYVAPAVVAAVAPVVAAPAPKESWKVIRDEKPVSLDGANFDFDSAKLRPTADARLQQVVDFAAKYPEAGMEVSGHTDDRGDESYNQSLSEKRATAVKAHLVNKGVAADRISAVGYGETKPVADNKTKDGRAANRRVEVRYTIIEEKRVRVQ